jgi:hypothetical protein
MLQQVLSQLAFYSTNTVNIGLVECADNRANINIALPSKITKLVAHFFEHIENHILEGSYPDTIPGFTPRDANPSIHKGTNGRQQPRLLAPLLKNLKRMCPLPALWLARGLPRSRNSKRALVLWTYQCGPFSLQ